MRRFLCFLFLIFLIAFVPTSSFAQELTAPTVPSEFESLMPEKDVSFSDGLLSMMQKVLPTAYAEIGHAMKTGIAVFCCVFLVSILQSMGCKAAAAEIVGAVCISSLILNSSRALIGLAVKTITEISEYSKLLLPVLVTASSAQGGIISATALGVGTSAFTAFLTNVLRRIMIPAVYLFLAAAIANCAVGEEALKKIRDQLRKGFQLRHGAAAWNDRNDLCPFCHRHGMLFERSRVVEAVRQYTLSLICAAVIVGILLDLSDKTGFQKQLRLVCGIFFAFILLRPLISLRFPDMTQFWGSYLTRAEEAASQGENIRIRSQAMLIRQETEAYILKEARAIGADVDVLVELNNGNPPVPVAVTLRGSFDASSEEQLGKLLADEVGIPKEHQTWIRQQSRSSGNSWQNTNTLY